MKPTNRTAGLPARLLRALLLLTTAGALACGGDGGTYSSNGTITIDNGSTHPIYDLRVAPINQVSWGPNLLSRDLLPNDRLVIDVSCGSYDVLVVDDRARSCTLGNLNLCNADQVWTLDDYTLRNCWL
jgi:hypothetical protein